MESPNVSENAQIWAYGRVSSQEQAENSHALEHQLARLQAAGVPDHQILYDVESGAKSERAKFKKLMGLAQAGKVKVIIATRWDRLMRNGATYQQFKELVQRYDVEIQLLDQGTVDYETAAGELQADLQALFAVYERNMLRERVLRGFAQRRQKKLGSGRPPWSYLSVEGKYQRNQAPCVCVLAERPDNYRQLYHDADDSERLVGLSKADIARDAIEAFLRIRQKRGTLRYLREKYGVPKRKCYKQVIDEDGSTKNKSIRGSIVFLDELDFWSSGKDLGDWLQNPVLAGHTAVLKYTNRELTQRRKPPSEWEVNQDTHPSERIVSPEEFAEIQAVLQLNAKKMGTPGATFYLTGLVFCGSCQTKAILKTSPRHKYYGCRHASAGCPNRRCARLETIDTAIINQIFEYANAPDHELLQEKERQQRQADIAKLQQQLKAVQQIPNLDSTPELLKAQQDLQHKIEALRHFKEPKLSPDSTAIQIIRHSKARNLNFWYTLTEDEREVIYPKLVDKIVIQAQGSPQVILKQFPQLQAARHSAQEANNG